MNKLAIAALGSIIISSSVATLAAQPAVPVDASVAADKAVDAGPAAVAAPDAGSAPAATEELKADPTVGPDVDVSTITKIVKDAKDGNWRAVAVGILSLFMFLWNWARKNVGFLKKKLAGDRAGAISLLVLAMVGGLLSTLASDVHLDAKTIIAGLWVAAEAAGVFLIVKKIFRPSDAADDASN